MRIEEAVETAEMWVGKNNRTHGGDVSVCLLQEVKSLRLRLEAAERVAEAAWESRNAYFNSSSDRPMGKERLKGAMFGLAGRLDALPPEDKKPCDCKALHPKGPDPDEPCELDAYNRCACTPSPAMVELERLVEEADERWGQGRFDDAYYSLLAGCREVIRRAGRNHDR